MAKTERTSRSQRVVVLGLGRFGASMALELMRRGTEVLALDSDPSVVQRYSEELTFAAVADTTDSESLQQLDVADYRIAVVGVGSHLEASILTTAALADLEIPSIWAKAVSRQHGRILERVGAHHVVLPEHDMGERVAHLVTGRMIDFIQFETDFAMAKTSAPTELAGMALADSALRTRDRVTVVGIKHQGERFTYAAPSTVVQAGDVLIVSGRVNDVEAFADRC